MNKAEQFINEYWNIIKFVSLIASIVAVFLMFDTYLSNKIQDQITDDSYISSLSKSLRPFLVFNEYGITEYDHGAKSQIEVIEIDLKKQFLIITTKSYLQNAPLISSIGANQYSYITERISDNKWKYTLLSTMQQTFKDDRLTDQPSKTYNLFVLEILK